MMSQSRDAEQLKLNEKKWNRWADTMDGDGWSNRFLREGQRRVVSLLNLRAGETLLDIGCGTGWALEYASRTVADSCEFYGVDLSPKMIEKASGKFKARRNFHFMKADSRSIPIDSSSIDAIICTHSFHHYPEPEAVMDEFSRLLKPGGRVLMLDPVSDTFFAKTMNLVLRILEREHVRMYSTMELQKMFENSHLKFTGSEKFKSFDRIQMAEKI